jgi:hypothetical protein
MEGSRLPLIGAIRWDAWHGDLGAAGKVVQETLRPERYHFRLPWFALVLDDGSVRIRCDADGVLEQEIRYARRAGLDYWAFVTYPENNALHLPLKQFLECRDRQGLRFCNIIEWTRFGERGENGEMLDRLARYFGHPGYVRVLDDRPLVYLLAHEFEPIKQSYGSIAGFAEVITGLRAEAREQAAGDPYVVVMTFDPATCESTRTAIGADGLSCYALPGGTLEGAEFDESQAKARRLWGEMAAHGPTIPLVSWGWDPRPRVDTPVPWYKPKPLHFATFTPEQCAQALEEALHWVRENPQCCPANAVIAYAWNEHDEGGWLCPTRNPDGSPSCDRIDAVGAAVRRFRTPP